MTPRRLTEEELAELMRVVVGDAHVAPIQSDVRVRARVEVSVIAILSILALGALAIWWSGAALARNTN